MWKPLVQTAETPLKHPVQLDCTIRCNWFHAICRKQLATLQSWGVQRQEEKLVHTVDTITELM
jgi:hypothetical protein